MIDLRAYEEHIAAVNAELHSLAAQTGNIATEVEHQATLLPASHPAAEPLKSAADRLNAIAQSANKLSVTVPKLGG